MRPAMVDIARVMILGAAAWYCHAAPLSRPIPASSGTRPSASAQPGQASPTTQVSPSPVAKEYEALIRRNLFAPLPKTEEPVISEGVFPLAEPEPLDRQVTLLGIVISTEPGKEKKYAIIEDSRSKEADFYQPGAMIRGYALKEITEKGAIFETFIGTRFILTQKGARYLAQPIQTACFRVNIMDALKQLERDFLKMKGFTAKHTAQGLALDNIPAGTILDKAGWADKDIVCTIAEAPVHSAADILAAYETALKTNTKTLVVGLLRNNVPAKIVYVLE
jgi:hypothetical protein